MQESTTYQAILEEGRAQGQTQGQTQGQMLALQKTLLRLGRQRFGAPSDAAQAAINAITDVARLERLTEHLLLAVTWQELLESSASAE
jgi:predicted transposase YdaD